MHDALKLNFSTILQWHALIGYKVAHLNLPSQFFRHGLAADGRHRPHNSSGVVQLALSDEPHRRLVQIAPARDQAQQRQHRRHRQPNPVADQMEKKRSQTGAGNLAREREKRDFLPVLWAHHF